MTVYGSSCACVIFRSHPHNEWHSGGASCTNQPSVRHLPFKVQMLSNKCIIITSLYELYELRLARHTIITMHCHRPIDSDFEMKLQMGATPTCSVNRRSTLVSWFYVYPDIIPYPAKFPPFFFPCLKLEV